MSEEKSKFLSTFSTIQDLILDIRGLKVMIDADLARLYGVSTKRLNEQVKRNKARFPKEFMFQLTAEEKAGAVANCDHLRRKLRLSRVLPYAFTEHGALMLASVLNSEIAINSSIEIVKAFVRMRTMLAASQELAKKINDIEKKVSEHDEQFKAVFGAIKKLILVDKKETKPIGFHANMKAQI